ncbi:MAG TPA: antibiotic biosynthesis monooxygenase [Blastocatellia bacterium]|nr:antibiotic biosynthesis monooxygenase [Blastocatellia bacterium]
MGVFVICAYRPKPGKEDLLREVFGNHLPVLRAEGLATDRPAHVMQSADGTIVEVFEWVSQEAIEAAHKNPNVQAMWGQFWEACDIDCVGNLEESKQPFSHFTPLDL